MTLLSVVTPARDMARYLPETLDGVAALRTPHEHIVIDGDSNDGTVEILEGRDDPNLTWVSEPDRGQTHAVNKGLKRARGDLVAWLNADDVYVAEAVDRAVRHLEETPETMAIVGGLEYIDENGEAFRTYVPPAFSWRRMLYLSTFYPTPTFIFRKQLLRQAPGLNEGYVDAADYDFYLRLLRGHRVERISEPLVRFRYHPESKSTVNVWKQHDEALEIRLAWARGGGDRLVMSGVERFKRAVLPRVSNWPHPHPSPLQRVAEQGSKWRDSSKLREGR